MFAFAFSFAALALRAVRAATGGPPPYSPALDFSDARNSQYLPLMF